MRYLSENDEKQIATWELGSRLFVRRSKQGHIPLGERAWAEAVDEQVGLTPEVVRNTRNRAGMSLTALVAQSGDVDILEKIDDITGDQPFEIFGGKLMKFYSGIGNKEALFYVRDLSLFQEANLSSKKRKPLLFYICGTYLIGQKSLEETVTLLHDFFALPHANVNVCNFDGDNILDLFDSEEDIDRHYDLIACLWGYGLNPDLSEKWMLDEENRLIRRPKISDTVVTEEPFSVEEIHYKDTPLPEEIDINNTQVSFFQQFIEVNKIIADDVRDFAIRFYKGKTSLFTNKR